MRSWTYFRVGSLLTQPAVRGGVAAVLRSEARRAERAEMLFFLAPVFAEETFEFLGEFVA
jgi:hypothetical protein